MYILHFWQRTFTESIAGFTECYNAFSVICKIYEKLYTIMMQNIQIYYAPNLFNLCWLLSLSREGMWI